MKLLRAPVLLLPVPFFLLASCDDKQAPESAGGGEGVAEIIKEGVEEVLPPSVSALSPEERAGMLGFAGHLAPDAELFMAIYDGAGMVRNLAELDVWQFARKVVEEEEGADPQDQVAEGAAQAEPFLGTEMFLAFGAGLGTQIEAVNEVQTRMSYHQFRVLARAFAEGAVNGDIEGGIEGVDDEAWLEALVGDVGRFMPQIEGAELPPVLAGLRITDEEQMGMAEQQLRDLLGMAAEGAEPVDFEKGGASFSGNRYKGEMLAEQAEQDREEMDEMVGTENVDRILAALREKEIVACVGRLDDYLLIYLGGSVEGCPVADDVSSSLVADARVSFIDGFKDAKVHGFVFGDEGMLEKSVGTGLKQIAEGCRDGIKGVEGFGDTRELAALLDMVGQREQALLDLYDPSTLGAVISLDGGARFDLFGGGDQGALDFESPHRLESLGDGEDVLFFANWTGNADYQEKASDLVELLVETAYATAGHLARLDVDSEELAQVKGGFEMFDGMFREDLLKLWDGLAAMENGLGDEAAFVVDLKAGFPPIPGVPAGVVEEGRFPRMSYVAPVEERARLQESWKKIDEAVRAMLATANEMGDLDLHMLDPTNSQKDDIVTWYFDALAYSDDLKPSVTVSDDWFLASTSKTQALDLMAEAGGSEGRKGLWAKLDLDVLRAYVEEALKIVEKNGDEIMGEGGDVEEFRKNLPRAMEGLASLEEFESITVHERRENGMRRATLHFHLR